MANTIERFTIRLYYGDNEDEAVAKHLAKYDQYKGTKTTQARHLLYLGLQALEQEERPSLDLDAIRQVVREEVAQTVPSLDRDAVRQAVQDAMQDAANGGESSDLTLADIRQVIDVVLQQHLDRLHLIDKNGDDDRDRAAVDAEAEGVLDQLSESLLMT